mmetsp:Transcript_40616/g.108693  ORF Transcript_40616/g.108693 Transcript_40616/m.108693 type:complete len:404 (+) Transcript_40616:78-1289(+)|eukprot:CAMPEP_0182546248 /NCGR_PEP_ID=MMETSP1323-20130603/35741_1 /TAXON_ID=236787 /ORGANISM="Florenciella parvula, Strain RCC1693" /LENGTH=403 /DNA_ID=CAMNT_0024757455 /DNA_START=13 /DNA_END=1224 /DNA_ORIENTATION=-
MAHLLRSLRPLRQSARALSTVHAGVATRAGTSNNQGSANAPLFGALAAASAAAVLTASTVDVESQRSHAFVAFDSDLKALEARVSAVEKQTVKNTINAATTNAAFVFVKPHAVTPAAIALVKAKFAAAGINVISEGDLSAETIDKDMLIDTHYGAIASKAVKLNPSQLNVQPKAKAAFKDAFGMEWDDAVAKGMVYNAMQGCEKLGIDGAAMDAKWGTLKKKGPGTNLIKFGGGFYCGQVDGIFVINGFYMQMRSAYTTPPAAIHWFTVEWPAAELSWEDFRGKVLGATDPTTAEQGSARREIFNHWKKLGLKSVPNTGDNGVHASASPAEALFERMNWLGASCDDDIFGASMLGAGISKATVEEWSQDPQVPFDGRNQSLFDLLEDMDAKDVLKKSLKIIGK